MPSRNCEFHLNSYTCFRSLWEFMTGWQTCNVPRNATLPFMISFANVHVHQFTFMQLPFRNPAVKSRWWRRILNAADRPMSTREVVLLASSEQAPKWSINSGSFRKSLSRPIAPCNSHPHHHDCFWFWTHIYIWSLHDHRSSNTDSV
jgi:hypothetical protein